MCTVSWHFSDRGLDLFFNRDESLTRSEAEPPVVEQQGDVNTLMPRDPVGGGSWLAANNRGLILALLNNYRYPTKISSDQALSRGLLVRRLSALEGIAGVRKFLADEILALYPPFFLLVFEDCQREPVQWEWDGETLKETWDMVESPISTSSLMPRLVPALRQYLMRRALRRTDRNRTASTLLALHRASRPWPATVTVAMKRKGSATVSLTHVRVTPDDIAMRYWPGHPSESASREPQETILTRGCSPSNRSVGTEPFVTNARQGCPCFKDLHEGSTP
ncbi:NRDE family protein [Marinobacter gelidimuriae]|uniref:NRDE family protein n=1 Tax=Marinobacter gelidimuriae TaxID=2739064 RepID=UPI0003732420|nr:NRDE family protein [Marinobacter gelidimuriae]